MLGLGVLKDRGGVSEVRIVHFPYRALYFIDQGLNHFHNRMLRLRQGVRNKI